MCSQTLNIEKLEYVGGIIQWCIWILKPQKKNLPFSEPSQNKTKMMWYVSQKIYSI